MASRTQIRLEQLTGSAVDLKTEAVQYVTPAAASALTGSDVRDLFGMVGAALSRIHGADADEPFNNTAGVLNQNTVISGSVTVKNTSDLSMFTVSSGIARVTVGEDNYTSDSLVTFRNDASTTYSIGHDKSEDVFAINNSPNFDAGGVNAFEIGSTGNASFANDVTVTGNLTVSGDTTTVNTTNLNIEDSIIGLGFSGSNPSPIGDRGILFGKASIGQAIPGLWYDAGNSDFNLATSITDAASSSFGTTTAYQNLNAGNLAVYEDAALRGEIEVETTSNDLIISSSVADLRLDANTGKILISKDGSNAGFLQADAGSNGLILSSSVDETLLLDANAGLIQFGKAANESDGNKVSAIIGGGASSESFSFIKSDDVDDNNFTLQVESHTAGTFGSQFVAVSGSLRLHAPLANGHYVALRAPNSITEGGNNYTLTLPADNGAANQFLQTDGNGVLTFADPAAAEDAIKKAIRVITGSHTAGVEVKFSAGAEITAGDQITTISDDGANGKSLDVYVNGQLLVSGSESERSAGDRDYAITAVNSLKFAFDLEIDDIVQVITRNN